MKVKIIKVLSPGDIEKERVSLKTLEDIEISNYAVMDHTFTQEGDLSDKGRHVYRFPSKKIAKDSFVVLYTTEGTPSEADHKDGKYHYFFWNRKNTVWNKDGGDTCTLMEVHDTHVVKVNTD